jgi:hypothetical protein
MKLLCSFEGVSVNLNVPVKFTEPWNHHPGIITLAFGNTGNCKVSINKDGNPFSNLAFTVF